MNSVTSPAAQVIIAIIPIAGIAIAGTVILLAFLWRHNEHKLRIQNGIKEDYNFNYKAYVLLIGLLLLAVGFSLTVFFIILNGKSNSILGGLIPFTVGIALLIFYKLNDWKEEDKSEKSDGQKTSSDKN